MLVGARLTDAPMTFLRSFGSKADLVLPLTWGLTAISILVIVIVSALLLRALYASPALAAKPNQPLPVERPSGGLAWIYVGTAISVLVLFGSAVWTMVTLAAVGQPPEKPALTVEVTGHQWWWQVRYRSDQPSHIFTTANEIHIPVGKPVEVKLATADVIHSFWVPALTGKTDLIPGQTNLTWIEARRARRLSRPVRASSAVSSTPTWASWSSLANPTTSMLGGKPSSNRQAPLSPGAPSRARRFSSAAAASVTPCAARGRAAKPDLI